MVTALDPGHITTLERTERCRIGRGALSRTRRRVGNQSAWPSVRRAREGTCREAVPLSGSRNSTSSLRPRSIHRSAGYGLVRGHTGWTGGLAELLRARHWSADSRTSPAPAKSGGLAPRSVYQIPRVPLLNVHPGALLGMAGDQSSRVGRATGYPHAAPSVPTPPRRGSSSTRPNIRRPESGPADPRRRHHRIAPGRALRPCAAGDTSTSTAGCPSVSASS